ncbi:MAG TPA: outer membrane protein transport protein [Nitrospira sp.]|nr:outer membrane protein transport protein [Nitrospira sp.]
MARDRTTLLTIFLGGAILFFVPSGVEAQALRFQPQGVVAAGQGNAFSAQADDPSAIHYNPAALSQVKGVQGLFGTALLGGSIQARSASGAETHGDFAGVIAFPPPAHSYISANLEALGLPRLSAVTVGLGLNSPFGLLTRYPADGPFNTAATFAALPLLAIKPTIAYQLTDSVSVGVSADIYTFAPFLGQGHAEQKLVGAGALGIPAGAPVELNGTGTGAGATVSILVTPLRNDDGKPRISIGVIYRTQVVLPLSGALLIGGTKVADASTNLVLPQIVTGAVAVWPVRNSEREWKIEVDAEFVGWGSYRNLDVQLSNGAMIPQPAGWKNVPVVAVGTEFKWLDPSWLPHWDIAVRSGYTRTENPVPTATFNPATISLSAHTLSVGAGLLCKGSGKFVGLIPCGGESAMWPKAIGLDVAYQEWFYDSFQVAGNVNPTVNGSYDASIHLGTFSFRFLF